MRPYVALRRFVDWDLASTGYIRSGAYSLAVTSMVAAAPLLFIDRPYSKRDLLWIAGALFTSAVWLSFVAWRGYRILRAASIRSNRKYDLRDKHSLPQEYASSESATKASRRG